jgi:hypothetical protein
MCSWYEVCCLYGLFVCHIVLYSFSYILYHFSTTLTEVFFRALSSVVRKMSGYSWQRRCTARTSKMRQHSCTFCMLLFHIIYYVFLLLCLFIIMLVICYSVLLCSVYCLCVNVYCTAVLCVLFMCKCVLYCCIMCTVCV